MAEIKIEKEKPVWPWIIIGILLLAVLLYFFVFRDKDNPEDTTQTVQTSTNAAAVPTNDTGGAFANYVSYVNGVQAMGLDHEYTSGALVRLANAIQEKASALNYTVQSDIDGVKNLADQITQDPMATTHANSIHRAAVILSTAMLNIQKAKTPGLTSESMDVKQAAESIDPEVLTLEQKEEVKSFLNKSSQLLQKLN